MARLTKGLTQSELAALLGITQTQQSYIELSASLRGTPHAEKYAALLEVSIDWLKHGGSEYPDTIFAPRDVLVLNRDGMRISTMRNVSAQACAWLIDDRSMEPFFQRRDIVIFDQISPDPGDYVLAKCGNKYLCRIYRCIDDVREIYALAPANTNYPTTTLNEACEIVGTWVEWRRLRRT